MQEIDITVAMFQKMRYNNLRIMLHPKSTFVGEIQMADPRNPDVVTSGCDRGGSITF